MRRVLFVLLLVLVAGAFVSCDLDNLFSNEETESQTLEEGDLTVYNSLPADTKAAVDQIGEVYGMYAPDVARFFNGQEITNGYMDINGNPTPLVFNSWLIAYKSLFGWVPEIFENAPKNAMFHNRHGYKDLSKLPKDLRYVEYCEYRYLETNEYHSAGDLCFIELRLVDGGVVTGSYYAKSLAFDPSLRYEIMTFGIDLLTGNHISYDYNKREVGPPRHILTYDDDARLVKVTYLDEDGTVTRWNEREYNQEGYLVLSTIYDGSGRKQEELYCEGIHNGKKLYSLTFDETEEPYEKTLFQYSQDQKTELRSSSFSLTDPLNPLTNEEFTPKSNPDADIQIKYNNLGVPELQWEHFGQTTRRIDFYPSGHIKKVEERDRKWNLISSTSFEDGNVHRIEVASMDDIVEEDETINFTTANPEYSLFVPVHLAFGLEPSNMVIEILVVDNEGNEIELDDSEFSIKFFGEDETVDISGEGSLVYRVPSDKWLESISVNLVKNDNIEATLKIKVNNNVILMGIPDRFTTTIKYNVPTEEDQSFFIDFSGEPTPIDVNCGDLFWYVVEKDTYDPDMTIYDAIDALNSLVDITGVEASDDSDTWFRPNGTGKFTLSVETNGNGTATRDVVVYFIYVQYTGESPTNVAMLNLSDLRELVKVPVVFYK